MATLNDEILSAAIRHAHFIERLKGSQANAVIQFMSDELLPDLERLVLKRIGRVDAGSQRLRQMLTEVREVTRGNYSTMRANLFAELKQIGISEAEWQLAAIRRAVPVPISLTMPSVGVIESAIRSNPFQGRLLSSWFTDMADDLTKGIGRQINLGLAQGESIPDITRRLIGSKTEPGLWATTRRNAEAVVRTSVSHTVNQAREVSYRSNDDMIEGVQYVATLDSRTTETCASLDGQVFEIGDGPRPPMHIRCRSTTVPVLKSWKHLGVDDVGPEFRESADGKVPAKTTYGEWLKRQPTEVQNEVLGVGKAQLFRQGTPIDKFVDNKFRPLTLAQVRQLEGI
jgi:SPP1 gp7 family putative phage head morphogenesis protein